MEEASASIADRIASNCAYNPLSAPRPLLSHPGGTPPSVSTERGKESSEKGYATYDVGP